MKMVIELARRMFFITLVMDGWYIVGGIEEGCSAE